MLVNHRYTHISTGNYEMTASMNLASSTDVLTGRAFAAVLKQGTLPAPASPVPYKTV